MNPYINTARYNCNDIKMFYMEKIQKHDTRSVQIVQHFNNSEDYHRWRHFAIQDDLRHYIFHFRNTFTAITAAAALSETRSTGWTNRKRKYDAPQIDRVMISGMMHWHRRSTIAFAKHFSA